MESYLKHLLADIATSGENASLACIEKEVSIFDFIPDEEEERYAPVRDLEEWTGIKQEQLPPSVMLTDEQVGVLLTALLKMLDAYNWSFVLQNEVPIRIQYETIRENFHQQVRVKRWNMGFFEMCRPGTAHGQCSLGQYCQCAFYSELFSGFVEEELSPEEERARNLEFEIRHLKRKYGDDWMKYYPYQLDANFDDEFGNPFDYGFGIEDDE